MKAGLTKAFMLASGGMVGNKQHHFYGSHNKLKSPAIEMVSKPQVRPLGVSGPDMVVPMIKRPGNKVNISDIPNLVKKYGGGKRASF